MALQPGTPSQVHGKAGHGEVRRAFGRDLLNVKNDVGKATGSIPNFTTNGGYKLYKPSKYGWFIIVFLTSSNKNEEITMKPEDMWGYYITNNIKP